MWKDTQLWEEKPKVEKQTRDFITVIQVSNDGDLPKLM